MAIYVDEAGKASKTLPTRAVVPYKPQLPAQVPARGITAAIPARPVAPAALPAPAAPAAPPAGPAIASAARPTVFVDGAGQAAVGQTPAQATNMQAQLARARAADTAAYTAEKAAQEQAFAQAAAPKVAPVAANAGKAARITAAAQKVGTKVRGVANSGLAKGMGALATAGAIAQATDENSTEKYFNRFGFEQPKTAEEAASPGGIAKFAAARALGFASDLGNNLSGGLVGRLFRDDPGGGAVPGNQLTSSSVQAKPTAAAPAAAEPGTGFAADDVPADAKIQATKVPGIVQAVGNGNPLYTNDKAVKPNVEGTADIGAPGGTFNVMEGAGAQAEKDKAKLQGYFQQHLNAGNVERARATAVTPEDYAALGQLEARAKADKERSSVTADIDRQITKAGELQDKATSRIGASLMKHSGLKPNRIAENAANQIQGLTAQKAGMLKQNDDPNAAAMANADVAIKRTQAEAAKLAVDQQKQVRGILAAMEKTSDPVERKRLADTALALQGKQESLKDRVVLEDVQVGTDALGSPIMAKKAFDIASGRPITDTSQQPNQGGQYVEGQTYADANGNKAVYRNGKFEPI